jgi:hypothetical protein
MASFCQEKQEVTTVPGDPGWKWDGDKMGG